MSISRSIFTALAPNEQPDDIRLALRLLLRPSRWKRGPARDELLTEFKRWLPARHAILFDSGRTAFAAILRSLSLEPGDEVLLQAFTCVAVPNSIHWAGAIPVYVDCRMDNFTMSAEDLQRKITPRSKVLVIQHTFGHAAHLKSIIHIAREHGLFVIEDCAHSIGSTHEGKNLGTFGDASFFSFGRDKALSSVFGGIAVTHDDTLAAKLQHIERYLPDPSLLWIKRQLLYPLVTELSRSTQDSIVGKSILAIAKILRVIAKPVYPEELRGERPGFVFHAMPNALAALALHQFRKLSRYVAHRHRVVRHYDELLEGLSVTKSHHHAEESLIRYAIQTPQAHYLLRALPHEGIYLGDWYTSVIAPPGTDMGIAGYVKGSCPHAEALAEATINLPTDIHITEHDVRRIISTIRRLGAI